MQYLIPATIVLHHIPCLLLPSVPSNWLLRHPLVEIFRFGSFLPCSRAGSLPPSSWLSSFRHRAMFRCFSADWLRLVPRALVVSRLAVSFLFFGCLSRTYLNFFSRAFIRIYPFTPACYICTLMGRSRGFLNSAELELKPLNYFKIDLTFCVMF